MGVVLCEVMREGGRIRHVVSRRGEEEEGKGSAAASARLVKSSSVGQVI